MAVNTRGFHTAAVGIALEAYFHALPRRDSAVPAHAGCGVGVAAAQVGIPGAGDAIAAGILPAGTPAGFGGRAVIGDADGAGKT